MIVSSQKELVARWVVSQVRDMPPFNSLDYAAIGVADAAGELIGGVVYTHYAPLPDGTFDIGMSIAGRPGWLTKATLRVFFGFPFDKLKCSRVHAIAAKSNRRSRDLAERLGFVQEGTIRGAFGTVNGRRRDGIIYGLLRGDCRWIDRIDQ